MINTGLVRKIDDLGRIVIPKEIRKSLNIRNGEELEIHIEDDSIILRKSRKLFSLSLMSQKYIDYFKKLMSSVIIVTDLHEVLSSNDDSVSKTISEDIVSIIENRQVMCGNNLTIDRNYKNYYLVPIISDANLMGAVISLSDHEIKEEDKVIVNIISILLKELIC